MQVAYSKFKITIMQSVTEVIKNLKGLLGIKTDLELARLINVKPNTISSWKSRETFQYDTIIELCRQRNIDLNEVFFDKYEVSFEKGLNRRKVVMVSVQNQLEYFIANKASEALNPICFFPTELEIDVAFQIGNDNMQPTIKVGSYALCKKVSDKIIHPWRVYVLVVEDEGILCNRFKGYSNKGELVFSNDSTEFDDLIINWDNIREVFIVNGLFLNSGNNL